jgi:hypothetical protein
MDLSPKKLTRIKLHGKALWRSCGLFGYGHYTADNKAFLLANINKEFDCTRHNMNYYKLPNGGLVHLYECRVIGDSFIPHDIGMRGQ